MGAQRLSLTAPPAPASGAEPFAALAICDSAESLPVMSCRASSVLAAPPLPPPVVYARNLARLLRATWLGCGE